MSTSLVKFTFEYSVEGGPITTAKSLSSAQTVVKEAMWGEVRWLNNGALHMRDFYRDGECYSTSLGECCAGERAEAIRANLNKLDGTNASVVSMLTGMSKAELDELGGVPTDGA